MTTQTGEQTPGERNPGPLCQCNATEARCAWVGGCCSSCGHWDGYDEHGDELPKAAHRPRLAPVDELTARRRAKWRAARQARTA